jgi:hypothetical protein
MTLLLEGVEERAPKKGGDAKSPKVGKEMMWDQVRKFFHAAGTRLTNPIIDIQQAIKRLQDMRRARGHGHDVPLDQGQRSRPDRSGASRQDKMTERADRLLDNLKRQRDEADALAQEAKEIEKSEKKSGGSEPSN